MTTASLRSLVLAGVFATAGAAPVTAQAQSLFGMLFDRCATRPVPPDSGTGPRIVISPAGQVLELKGPITEADSVRVVVVGNDTLLSRLLVTRTSSTRVPGAVNVAGQGDRVASEGQCKTAMWILRDFAPGIGEIEMRVAWPSGGTQDSTGYAVHSLAKIGFPVNTLYAGALFFGPIITTLANPAFGIRANAGDSMIKTIEYATRPGARTEYALFYTPFWFSKRDIEVDRSSHFDPVIGLVLNDVPNNFLVGLTAHFGYTFYAVGGVQWGRVQRLDDSSPFGVGARIEGGAEAIPVNTRFAWGLFGGFGLDLRAVGRLFGLVSK